MQRAERIWDATHVPFLESPLHGVRSLLRQAYKVGDLATIAPWKTLRTLGTHYLRDPRLRMFLDRYATYTGSDPRKAPAALAVVPYVEQAFGAWYVEGGLHLLGHAMADRAVERGATLRLGTEVTAITVAGNRVDGVTLADGSRLPADVVVANADASVRLPRSAAAQGAATPARAHHPVAVRLRRAPRPAWSHDGLAHHTVLFPEDYDAEFDAVFGGRPAERPDGLHQRTGRPARPRTATKRGSSWSTPPGTVPSTGTPRPTTTPATSSTSWRGAGSTSGTASPYARSVHQPTSSERPAPPVGRSTAARPTARWPLSSGQPTHRP